MAQTYTIGEALTLAYKQIGRGYEEDYASHAANMAQNLIWNRYDWRETIGALPPFYLVGNEQEFGPPSAVIPSNFLGLRKAYLTNITTIPARREEIKVRRDLSLTGAQGLTKEISYEPTTGRFRVFPRVPNGIGAADWVIEGTYKKKPTKIIPSALSSTLIPWDDLYFQDFLAVLKWAAYETAGDQRAGEAQYSGGNVAYTGALAKAMAAIDLQAEYEGLNLGDPTIAPSEPLVIPNSYGFLFPGLG